MDGRIRITLTKFRKIIMGLNLERLAQALKLDTNFSEEDRNKINEMRQHGIGLYSARDEIFAGKILKRINELVNKLESESKE